MDFDVEVQLRTKVQEERKVGALSLHQPLQVIKETRPGEMMPSWYDALAAIIPDTRNLINSGLPGNPSALSNYPPVGSTTINDQMEAITWGALGGLPIIGIYVSGIGYVTGRPSSWEASLATMGITTLSLYYLWPRGSAALWEWSMYRAVSATGFTTAEAGVGGLLPSGSHIGWRVPMWARLLGAYGAYKAAEFNYWYYFDARTTDLDRDKKMRSNLAPR